MSDLKSHPIDRKYQPGSQLDYMGWGKRFPSISVIWRTFRALFYFKSIPFPLFLHLSDISVLNFSKYPLRNYRFADFFYIRSLSFLFFFFYVLIHTDKNLIKIPKRIFNERSLCILILSYPIMSQDFQLSSSHFFNKLLISVRDEKEICGKEPGAVRYIFFAGIIRKKKNKRLEDS